MSLENKIALAATIAAFIFIIIYGGMIFTGYVERFWKRK